MTEAMTRYEFILSTLPGQKKGRISTTEALRLLRGETQLVEAFTSLVNEETITKACEIVKEKHEAFKKAKQEERERRKAEGKK